MFLCPIFSEKISHTTQSQKKTVRAHVFFGKTIRTQFPKENLCMNTFFLTVCLLHCRWSKFAHKHNNIPQPHPDMHDVHVLGGGRWQSQTLEGLGSCNHSSQPQWSANSFLHFCLCFHCMLSCFIFVCISSDTWVKGCFGQTKEMRIIGFNAMPKATSKGSTNVTDINLTNPE